MVGKHPDCQAPYTDQKYRRFILYKYQTPVSI